MWAKIAFLVPVTLMLVAPPTAEANSHATITGEFSDACRDFTAHASKDISHVVIRYGDGSVVKDETIASRDFSVDGGPGDEIASVVVKSGTTSTSFPCQQQSAPPVATLEIFTPPIGAGDGDDPTTCFVADAGDGVQRLGCSYDAERSRWTQWEAPGLMLWGICPGVHNEHCAAYPFDEIPWTFDFRGSSSTDPDGDLSHWTIDFGDGTSTSGSWESDPPVGLEHTYITRDFSTETGFVTVTLTVTDAAGHTDTDTLSVGIVLGNDV